MHQSQSIKTFQQSTRIVSQGNYLQARNYLLSLLASHPDNSAILNNLGLIETSLRNDKQAMLYLKQSIGCNHLNYIAYFNLFSILSSNQQKWQGYRNLCCGVSCLYLLRARSTNKIEDVNSAIMHSFNNIEARILRACLLMQYHRFEEGQQEMKIVQSMICSLHLERKNERQFGPLQSDMVLGSQQDKMINEKVKEYNELYQFVTQQCGNITRCIQSSQLNTYLKESQASHNSKENDSMIAILQDEEYFKENIGEKCSIDSPGGTLPCSQQYVTAIQQQSQTSRQSSHISQQSKSNLPYFDYIIPPVD